MKLLRNLRKTMKILTSSVGLVVTGIGYIIFQMINILLWIPTALFNNLRYRLVRSSLFITIFFSCIAFYENGKVYLQETYGTTWNKYWSKVLNKNHIDKYIDHLVTSFKAMSTGEILSNVFTFAIIVFCMSILIKCLYFFFRKIDLEIDNLKFCSHMAMLVFLDEIKDSFTVITYGTKKERERDDLLNFREKYGPFETISTLLEKQSKFKEQ